MRRPIAYACVCLLALVTGAGQAACLSGAWQGTLGTAPISLELEEDSGAVSGRYYYRDSMRDMLLRPVAGKLGTFEEVDPKDKVTGKWFLACKDAQLIAEWQGIDGRKLPLALTRNGKNKSYSDARFATLKTRVIKKGQVGTGRFEQYRVAEESGIVGVALFGAEPGLADINRHLRKQFLNTLEEQLSCSASGRLKDGNYYAENTWSVQTWNARFVVVSSEGGGYCGEAHPNWGSSKETFDLQTGKREEIKRWLLPEYEGEIDPDSKLGKLLLRLYKTGAKSPQDKEQAEYCSEAIRFSGYAIAPSAKGMIFKSWAPYVNSACINEVVVSHARIAAFLSPAGKAGMLAFQER